ncbi:MAG: hypothetical protein IT455_16760 [Planctomycetes bacterium]|nr:hypothetical protein [Planctomycetota bacterium]
MLAGPARCFFLLQGLLVIAWWCWLLAVPAARAAFVPGGLDAASLIAWAPADLLLLAPASLGAALPWRQRPAVQLVLPWCVTAALAYAAFWCVAASARHGGGWSAGVCMSAAAFGSGVAASWRKVAPPAGR